MANESPLTDVDLTDLQANLAELDKADKLIDQSMRAGIDVSVQKERAKDARDRLMRMKQAFFPGK